MICEYKTGINEKKAPGLMGGCDCLIENANIVTPKGILEESNLLIQEGRIASIGRAAAKGKRIKAKGLMLLPGIIDLHSDALEKAIEPRPGSVFPINMALSEFDKTLTACGITTMFYCVAFAVADLRKNKLRRNDQALKITNEIRRMQTLLRTRSMIHARFDILNGEAVPMLIDLVEKGCIDLLSFMDHTPGQGQFREIEKYREIMVNHYNYDPLNIEQNIERRIEARESLFPVLEGPIIDLAITCQRCGITLASHDDDSRDKVEWARELDVSISEFPVNFEAALAARDMGLHVALGAPNLVRGGSQSGNICVRKAYEAGVGNILCSDYSPMSMFHSIFVLDSLSLCTLPEAVNQVSLNPARAMGMDGETGSIEENKLADLILVDMKREVPRILRTFVGGVEVFRTV